MNYALLIHISYCQVMVVTYFFSLFSPLAFVRAHAAAPFVSYLAGAGLGWGGLDRALPHLQKELVSFLWCSTSFCPFRKSSAALNIS